MRLGFLGTGEITAAMNRRTVPELAAEGELAATLQKLSTEGGLNATLRAAMAPAKNGLRRGFEASLPGLV